MSNDITTLAAKLEATEQHAERGWQEAHEQEARAEAAEKKVAFLKDRLSQLANFNPDWDMLEAATESLREHMAELKSAQAKIAELEARTLTVKLPEPKRVFPSGVQGYTVREVETIFDRAGIKLQIEE